MRALSVSLPFYQNALIDKRILIEQLSGLIPFLHDYLSFVEEFKHGAGHAVLPANITEKPLFSNEGVSLISRTSKKNLFVLGDAPEAPLPMISAVQRLSEKIG
jgi:hypothetical protein